MFAEKLQMDPTVNYSGSTYRLFFRDTYKWADSAQCRQAKISKSQKQIMMSYEFRSFFGRIRDFIICFQDLLTFTIYNIFLLFLMKLMKKVQLLLRLIETNYYVCRL